MTLTLNDSQAKAFDNIVAFLATDDKYIIIDGSGGTGKSFLINYIKDNALKAYHDLCRVLGDEGKSYSIDITSTTNKACESLKHYLHDNVPTIHSYIGLVVKEDFSSGEVKVIPSNAYQVRSDKVVIIDECSMIDSKLLDYIKTAFIDSKIIFVGDRFQLAPIKESSSPVYDLGAKVLSLDTYMRQSYQELKDLATATKNSVMTKSPITINTSEYVKVLSKDEALNYLNGSFNAEGVSNKIVAYTNATVLQYSKYLNALRGYTEPYNVGECFVVNNTVHTNNNSSVSIMFHTEDEVVISDIKPAEKLTYAKLKDTEAELSITVQKALLTNLMTKQSFWVFLPVDMNEVKLCLKLLAKDKNWEKYFLIKNYLPDLRPRDTCTVHKSQGATVNDVFIDLEDLCTCRNKDTFYRLLYVACTRAREHVYFYGSMKPSLGVINERM